MLNRTFFNFGRSNHLGLSTIVDDDDYGLQVGRWLNGRIFGFYVNVLIQWRKRLDNGPRP
jgi:hypothetical protein